MIRLLMGLMVVDNRELCSVVRSIVQECADELDIHLEGGGAYSTAFNNVIAKCEERFPG